MDKIIFLVRRPDAEVVNVILSARDREGAKREARYLLGGDPDTFIVEPLTKPGDKTILVVATD